MKRRSLNPSAQEHPFFRFPPEGPASVVLWNEDSVVGLRRRLTPRSVSVVVTSPPYNRGVVYRSYEDSRPRATYLAWIGDLARSVKTALEPDGSFFLNLSGSPKDPWIPWDVARIVQKEFVLQNVIHWVKSIVIERAVVGQRSGLAQDLAVGHYKPVQSDRYLHGAHEYVFHFTRTGAVPLDRLAAGTAYQDKTNVGRWKRSSSDRRCRGNTWFLPYATIRSRAHQRPHPASFPPELAERCVLLHGVSRTRLMVDPFLGIGSSGIAAVRLGVPFAGFEIDREYLEEARKRIQASLSEQASRTRASVQPS